MSEVALNKYCECKAPGFCPRHGIEKTPRKFELCKGLNCRPADWQKYWDAWEAGKQPGQTAAVEKPKIAAEIAAELGAAAVEKRGPLAAGSLGAGDWISRQITRFTGIMPCGGCKGRAATLNEFFRAFFPPDLPPVETVDLGQPVRHFMCHLWPVKGYGAWQWNCDRILAAADLFNGRRIVSIVTSPETDPPEAVMEKLCGFTDEFIIKRNNPHLREVMTWLPMLERLEKYQGETDVTYTCHGKCVRHRLTRDSAAAGGSTIFKWTEAMYDATLAWAAVRPLLEKHATVGAFRRYTAPEHMGWGPWHWTGSFFWFRNRDAFRRNWRFVPQRFYGTEAWPGRLFRPDEAGVLIADNVGDFYLTDAWRPVDPLLQAFREKFTKGSP